MRHVARGRARVADNVHIAVVVDPQLADYYVVDGCVHLEEMPWKYTVLINV